MRKKGTKNKNYSPEFKISVILDMRNNHLSYCKNTILASLYFLSHSAILHENYSINDCTSCKVCTDAPFFFFSFHSFISRKKTPLVGDAFIYYLIFSSLIFHMQPIEFSHICHLNISYRKIFE